MPVTVSHPVFSVGFKKFGLVLSALVVGSMMPDFEFFMRLSFGKNIGHTLAGIFLFCIPVGLVVLFLFHKLMKLVVNEEFSSYALSLNGRNLCIHIMLFIVMEIHRIIQINGNIIS